MKLTNLESVTVLVLGGSISRSHTLKKGEKSYVKLLEAYVLSLNNLSRVIDGAHSGRGADWPLTHWDDSFLAHSPVDLVIGEFAANDADANLEHMYTPEVLTSSMVYKLWYLEKIPVPLLYLEAGWRVFSESTDIPDNAELSHAPVLEYYGVPTLSLFKLLLPEYQHFRFNDSYQFSRKRVFNDYVHPSPFGHAILFYLVTEFFVSVYQARKGVLTSFDHEVPVELLYRMDLTWSFEENPGRLMFENLTISNGWASVNEGLYRWGLVTSSTNSTIIISRGTSNIVLVNFLRSYENIGSFDISCDNNANTEPIRTHVDCLHTPRTSVVEGVYFDASSCKGHIKLSLSENKKVKIVSISLLSK